MIEGLTPGQSYTFGVKSVAPLKQDSKTYMQSINCSAVDVKTSEKIQTKPVLQATETGNKITWEAVSKATLYQVYCMSPLTEYEWEECAIVISGGELLSKGMSVTAVYE